MKPDRSKYRQVIDALVYQIHTGGLAEGEPFPSRREICERYGISLVPASKVQQELQLRGLISRLPGHGFTVNSPEHRPMPPLQRIRVLGPRVSIGRDTIVGSMMLAGIRAEAAKSGIEVIPEYADVLNNTSFQVRQWKLPPNEGLIPSGDIYNLPEFASVLANPFSRIVLFNNVAWEHTAVLVDNYHGMSELLRYHRERGARRVLFVGRCAVSPLLFNESERHFFFENLAAQMGFEFQSNLTGNFRSALEQAKAFRPDGILFTGDDVALHFQQSFLPSANLPNAIVTGFDDILLFPKKYPADACRRLTTYHVDFVEMGRRAVRLLFHIPHYHCELLHERVKGQLVIR